MKMPKFPKFKLPKWNFNFKLPKWFHWPEIQKSFYSTWKKFIRQIPRESRATVNSYQHFIVLGGVQSGKTELIRGLIEQSQDLYPFDTSYTEDPDIQFYLGPNQVIQEISFASLEDKSIRGRRKAIKLWKKLYVRRDPIIIISYNCLSSDQNNLRDLNRLAQLIAGKVSLLSEIIKKPLKVRIALTHLDKVPGYLEFARFLKQENLSFEIPLSTEFESNTLEQSLKKFFEEHITLMLTSSTNRDFSKMLAFSKEMPAHFHAVEEFLRGLVSRVSFTNSIALEKVSFTSNQESSTSFNPFQWTKLPSMEIFFRYPLLKHQLASAGLLLLLVVPLFHYYTKEKNELNLAQRGIDQLDLMHYDKFQEKILPAYVSSLKNAPSGLLAYVKPRYFGEKLDNTTNQLAEMIREHYIEQEYRKAVLENRGELKCLYFDALMHATCHNTIGRFMLDDSKDVATALNMDENILIAYISSCKEPPKDKELFNFSKVNPFVPFTSFAPWESYLKRIQGLCQQQNFVEQSFKAIVDDSERLITAVNRLKDDPLPYRIAKLLEKEKGKENCSDNIRVIHWVGNNIDGLADFLDFVKRTSTVPINIKDMNVNEFFMAIKERSTMSDQENLVYNFSLNKQLYTFNTKEWIDLVVAHNVERAIRNYIALNNHSGGAVFFKNTSEAPEPEQPIYNTPFPYFNKKILLPGAYSRLEYENKVRSTSEKIAHWVSSLTVNPEDCKRFIRFLVDEIVDYKKTYEDHYCKYFDACDIQISSLEDLRKVLYDIAQDSSSFHDFLNFMDYQTSAFSEEVLTLKNMRELNQFDFLNKILAIDKGEAPYAKYQRLMLDLSVEVDAPPSAGDTEFEDSLKPYLTSLAKISSDILQNNSKSYLNRVKGCLNEIGVPEKFHSVFVKPIQQLYRLGLPDLKRCIEHSWYADFSPRIDLVLAKFPFNPDGTETLSLEELENTFNPSSEFYRSMKEVMSKCCKNNEGIWRPLDSTNLALEEGIFVKLNQVQKITDILWDKSGNPQSIAINIQSVPFTNGPDDNPVIVRSYLVLGDQSIRNINASPTWQTIKVDWWKTDNCSVGIELMNKYTNSRFYKHTPPIDQPWSFFELLRKGYADHRNVLTWNLADECGGDTCYFSLCFEKNPKLLLMQ